MNKQIDISRVVLKTKRLTLRPWKLSDLQDFYEYASIDGVGQMAGWNPHQNIEESKKILEMFIRDKRTFALEYQGKVIGSIGIEEYEEENYPELDSLQGREIGYVLSKAYWGNGLMPEAVRSVISYLFDTVEVDFILVGHFEWNMQSRRVIEKCGFEKVKTKKYKTQYGTIETSEQYILYHSDYKWKYSKGRFTVQDDEDLVRKLYKRYAEEERLTQSKVGKVEFLTNVHYIEKYIRSGDKILDIGAGTGEYSLYFSGKGYQVSALELSEKNIEVFRRKIDSNDSIDLVQGNALDLSRYDDETFDIVLVFGPLYHLHNDEDKLKCIQEAKRVCKKNGKILFAFISNDIVVLTMQQEHADYLLHGAYDKETFQLYDYPFVFHTLERCRDILRAGNIRIQNEVASDGISELLKDMIERMDEESYRQYFRYHLYLCEKKECLGMSNHLLFIGR